MEKLAAPPGFDPRTVAMPTELSRPPLVNVCILYMNCEESVKRDVKNEAGGRCVICGIRNSNYATVGLKY